MKLKILMLLLSKIISIQCQNYVIIKPVVDLVIEKIPNILLYDKMPLSPINKKDRNSCPRIHQLLFNEIVKVIKEDEKELVIEAPNIFYEKKGLPIRSSQFRTLKKNLISLESLKKAKLDISKFPLESSPKIIYLKYPFKNKLNNKVYSAGTKFTYEQIDEKNYHANIFNPEKLKFEVVLIPKKICLESSSLIDPQQKINNFVKLLKSWANIKKGFIPYVWGGCSFCDISNEKVFEEKRKTLNKKAMNFYHLAKYDHRTKPGFDCSGLILRAAQITGIPFPYKNSTTISQNLKPLQENDVLKNGDIIWFSGHVMIISDIKHNLIIEATDYSDGYGEVHEILLSQKFKNIETFDDLKNSFFQNKSIDKLHKNGTVSKTISDFKILKLISAFN